MHFARQNFRNSGSEDHLVQGRGPSRPKLWLLDCRRTRQRLDLFDDWWCARRWFGQLDGQGFELCRFGRWIISLSHWGNVIELNYLTILQGLLFSDSDHYIGFSPEIVLSYHLIATIKLVDNFMRHGIWFLFILELSVVQINNYYLVCYTHLRENFWTEASLNHSC